MVVEYNNKVNIKLPESKMNTLKTTVKNQIGATLRMNIRMFNGNNLPHGLLLIIRPKKKKKKEMHLKTISKLI